MAERTKRIRLEKNRVEILRGPEKEDKATYGSCVVYRENIPVFASLALERAYLNNKKDVSALYKGNHKAVIEYSPKFRRSLWELKDTEGRTEIKFHPASFWDDLEGCIALGYKRADIDNDGVLDLVKSRDAIDDFMTSLAGLQEVQVIIK